MAADPQPMPPLLLSERDAARAMGVTPRTLYTLRQTAGLPHLRIGSRVLYRPEALRAWAAERERASEPAGVSR